MAPYTVSFALKGIVVRIELKDIKGGLLEQHYDKVIADFPELLTMRENGGAGFKDPIHFSLRLQRVGQIVEIDGHLNAEVELACGRCLKSFFHTLSEQFSLTFSPQDEDQELTEDMELDAEELGLIYYQGEAIDLSDPLQEQLIMALPISPVCGDECGGLCPECGRDLNTGSCQCEKKPFNNKFSALADLKLKK